MNRIKRGSKHAKRSRARWARSGSGCGQGHVHVRVQARAWAPADSHRQLVDQVAALTVVVVQLWELNNALAGALGLERTPLPVAGSMACVAWRGV